MSVLTAVKVGKTFPGHSAGDPPVCALKDVSFSVADKEFCALLGHSGCGKTTLLSMMAGFDQPTEGHLLLDDKPVGKPGWERTMIFQDYALFPWQTVQDNIAFGLEMKNIRASERSRIVQEYITLVGLTGFERRYPHQLSGGMRQRVSIARALAVDPQVLLMDEPFAALDALTRTQMQEELLQLWSDTRITILFVTHSIDEAIRVGNRILLLSAHPGTVKAEVKSSGVDVTDTSGRPLSARIHDQLFLA